MGIISGDVVDAAAAAGAGTSPFEDESAVAGADGVGAGGVVPEEMFKMKVVHEYIASMADELTLNPGDIGTYFLFPLVFIQNGFFM